MRTATTSGSITGHWAIIRHFALFRAGLAGSGRGAHVSRGWRLFPFTLLFLLSYAAIAHLGRQSSKVGKVNSMKAIQVKAMRFARGAGGGGDSQAGAGTEAGAGEN